MEEIKRLIAFILGIYLLWNLGSHILGDIGVCNWSETTGRVVESRVENHAGFLKPIIKFEYKVNNHIYQNNHLGSAFSHHYEISRSSVERLMSYYPLNKDVKVFFNPSNPKMATLNLNFSRPVEEWGGFFTFLLGMGLLMFSWKGFDYPGGNSPGGFPINALATEDFRKRIKRSL